MMTRVDLSQFTTGDYQTGRNFFIRTLWFCVNALFFQNPLNASSKIKVVLLRLFGAEIGSGVVLKPSINVKYPWLLTVGDHAWVGEQAWLDNLVPITIGAHACVSQGVYLCTGNHDWSDAAFSYKLQPIVIEDGAWIGARATILPGVTVSSHSVITGGSVVSKNTEPYLVYSGNPAIPVKQRVIRNHDVTNVTS